MKWAIKNNDPSVLKDLPSSFDLLLGNAMNQSGAIGAGTIGEICALALILGLIYMLWKKIITWYSWLRELSISHFGRNIKLPLSLHSPAHNPTIAFPPKSILHAFPTLVETTSL